MLKLYASIILYAAVQASLFVCFACDPYFDNHPLLCVAQSKHSLVASSLPSCLFLKGRISHLNMLYARKHFPSTLPK